MTVKTAIFIDGVYLGKFQLQKSKPLNFEKLNDELTKGDFRVRTYYYTCMPYLSNPPTKQEQELYNRVEKFHEAIDKIPRFEIKLGRLQKIGGKFTQKGVDMQLGVDMVQMSTSKQIDKAILIANDSDFVYAIEKAKSAGVVTTLVYFSDDEINPSLVKAADEKIKIDDAFVTKCQFIKK